MEEPAFIVLKELAGNEPVHLLTLQRLLEPHIEILVMFWRCVWVATALYLAYFLYRAYRRQRNR